MGELLRLGTMQKAKLNGQSITMFQAKLLRNLGLELGTRSYYRKSQWKRTNTS